MTSKANTIDLGELQDNLESAEKRLKSAKTSKSNAYDRYVSACGSERRAIQVHNDAVNAIRTATDALTV